MANAYRSIDTRFWTDAWVRKLNALDRYLFIYLLTNTHATWCGVYELDLAMMAFESGVDKEDLVRSMLPRLSPKVIYVDDWVYVPNWLKYHVSESGNLSPTQKKGVDEAWKSVPERIRLKIKEIEGSSIPYAYPIGGVSASASAFTSAFTSASTFTLPERTPSLDKIKGFTSLFKELNPMGWKQLHQEPGEIKSTLNLLDEKDEAWWKAFIANYSKRMGERFCPKATRPSEMEEKFGKIMAYMSGDSADNTPAVIKI